MYIPPHICLKRSHTLTLCRHRPGTLPHHKTCLSKPVRMGKASPWKSHLWITELAFPPAFRQRKLVCSLFKNCPMVISYVYLPQSCKVPKDRKHKSPTSFVLWTQPVTAMHPAGTANDHGFLPPISLLSSQVQSGGLH